MTDTEEQAPAAKAPQSGATLAKAREARELTVAAAAEALHLDIAIVEAMEQDRFADLGAPVFARGHLRKYASLVDVDTAEALAGFEAAQDPDVLPPVVPDVEPRTAAAMLTPTTLGIAGMVLLVLILFVWFIGSGPGGDVVEPAAGPVANAPAANSLPLQDVEADRSSNSAAAASRAADAEPTDVAELTPIATPVNAVSIEPSVDILVLNFSADCWTEVRDAEGRQLYSATATEGARLVLEGLAPFDLVIGNRRAVAIELNGANVAIPGTAIRGRTARFSTPGRDF